MRQRFRERFLAGIMAVMLALLMGAGMTVLPVEAASGNIYSCRITPCYAHPVTGTIEDSGGEASYATGQGMVEGAVYTTGMMEVTDNGEYYLTFRLSLMDYTSNHSFTVQNVGDSGWMSASMGVTGTGSDTNGATADVCIQVPSENCIVRGSMYVEPMGRNVIFYLYPSNYVSGTVDSMHAAMVTEASASDAVEDTGENMAEDTAEGTTDDETPISSEEGTSQETAEETAAAAEALPESKALESEPAAGDTQTPVLQSTLSGTAAVPSGTQSGSAGGAELNGTRGLSLSTESGQAAESMGNTDTDAAGQVLILTTAITISGLILLAAVALTVYYFRRNWNRWGGMDDEDDE